MLGRGLGFADRPTSRFNETDSGVDLEFRWYAGSDVTAPPIEAARGGNTHLAVNLEAGIYTLEVLNRTLNCLNTRTVELLHEPETLTLDPTEISLGSNTRCLAPFNGNIAVQAISRGASGRTTSLADFEFSYYQGTTLTPTPLAERSGLADGLEEGFYSITVSHPAKGCVSTPVTVEVEANPGYPVITPVSITDNAVCDPALSTAGSFNGGIELSVIPPSNLSVQWYAGVGITQTLQSAVPGASLQNGGLTVGNLPDGTYNVSITDNATRCEAMDQIFVGDAASPLTFSSPPAGVVSEPLSTCEASPAYPDGAIRVDPSSLSGQPPYRYSFYLGSGAVNANLLSDGDNIFAARGGGPLGVNIQITAEEIQGLSGGDYTVVVVEQQTGCQTLPTTLLVVEDAATPTLLPADVVKTDNTSCLASNGAITVQNVANGGTRPEYRLFAGTVSQGPILRSSDSGVFDNVDAGVYSVAVWNRESWCLSNGVTVVIVDLPFDFSSDINVAQANPQSSCNPALPTGQLRLDVAGGVSGYDFRLFSGQTVDPSMEVTASRTEQTNQIVFSSLPAGIYRGQVTHAASGCAYTSDAVITTTTMDPQVMLTPSPSSRCSPGNGAIAVEVGTGIGAPPLNGSLGFNLELFEQADSGNDATPVALATAAAPGIFPDLFPALEEGSYVVRVTDVLTSCTTQTPASDVPYDGAQLTFDESLIVKRPISGCFETDGFIDITDGLTLTGPATGDVSIAWYAGTDASDPVNLLSNLHNIHPAMQFPIDFRDASATDGVGNPITLINARIGLADPLNPTPSSSGLPAISYTGIATLSNGCTVILNTSLSHGEAPDTQIMNPVDPRRCSLPFDGSFDIVVDPVDPTAVPMSGNSSSQFNYFVYEGTRAIGPDLDLTTPYDPNLASYSPLRGPLPFTSTTLGDPETLTVSGLSSGFYTVGVEFGGDQCIVFVGTVELEAPPEATVSLTSTKPNYVCDPALDQDGSATVTASHPDGGTLDFSWYYDFDGISVPADYDFSTGSRQQVVDGPGGAGPGSVVAGSMQADATSNTISGLPAGYYQVVATHNAAGSIPPGTGCADTLNISLYTIPRILSIQPADLISSAVTDCGVDNGRFELSGIRQDANPPSAGSDSFSAIEAGYSIRWMQSMGGLAQPFVPLWSGSPSEARADNLQQADYSLSISSDATGCTTSLDFEIADDTQVPVVRLLSSSDNASCNIQAGTNPPTGALTLQIEDYSGTVLDPSGFNLAWFKDRVDPAATRVPMDLETDATLNTTLTDSGLSGISGGTYLVEVTDSQSPSLNCASQASFIVDDVGAPPLIVADQIGEDPFCDPGPDGTNGGGLLRLHLSHEGADPAPPANYDIRWYRGSSPDPLVELTPPLVTPGSTLGFNSLLDVLGVSTGSYYLEATRTVGAPLNSGCSTSIVLEVGSDPMQVGLDVDDVDVEPNSLCTAGDASLQVLSTRIDGAERRLDDPAIGADFSFQWTGLPVGTLPVDINSMGDRVEALEAGNFEVETTNSTTGCSSGALNLEITDDIDFPVLSAVVLASNTACSAPFTGEISSTGSDPAGRTVDASRFDFFWYHSDRYVSGSVPDYSEPVSSVSSSGYSDLEEGSYTVRIVDNLTGCEKVESLVVELEPDIPTLDEQQLVATLLSDTSCTADNGMFALDGAFLSGFSLGQTAITLRDQDGNILDANGSQVPTTPFDPAPVERIEFNGLQAGSYSLTIVGQNGCSEPPIRINVADESFGPLITPVSSVPDSDCGVGMENVGGVSVTLDGGTEVVDYDIVWRIPSSGETVAAVYPSVADDGLALAGVGHGIYEVEVRRRLTGCESTLELQIPNEPVAPVFRNYQATPVTLCQEVDSGSILTGASYRESPVQLESDLDFVLRVYTGADTLAESQVADGDSSTRDIVEGLPIGKYYATLENALSGCVSTPLELNVEDERVYPPAFAEQVNPDRACEGTQYSGQARAFVLDAAGNPDYQLGAGGYTASWRDQEAAMVGSTPELEDLPPGPYSLTITDTGTGCEGEALVTIENEPLAVSIVAHTVIQPTRCSPPDGSVQVIAVNPGAAADYEFLLHSEPPTAAVEPGVFDSPVVSGLSAGRHFIQARDPATGCLSELVEFTLTRESLRLPMIGLDLGENPLNPASRNNTSCDSDEPNGRISVAVLNAPEGNSYVYQWQDPQGLPAGDGSASLTGLAGGIYGILVADASSGCTASGSFEVQDDVDNLLAVTVSTTPNTNCVMPNGAISASVLQIQGNFEFRGLNYTYFWLEGHLEEPSVEDALYMGSTIQSVEDGPYTVVAVDNVKSCFTSGPVHVTISEAFTYPNVPLEKISDATNCYEQKPNGAVRLLDPDETLFRKLVDWERIPDTSQDWAIPQGQLYLQDLDAGDYRVLVTDKVTGCFRDLPFSIASNPTPPPPPDVFVISPVTHCVLPNGTASASVEGAVEGFGFEWQPEGGETSESLEGALVHSLQASSYLVTATDALTGCSSDSRITVGEEILDPVIEIESVHSVCLRSRNGAVQQYTGSASIEVQQGLQVVSAVWQNQDEDFRAEGTHLIDAPPGDYQVDFQLENGCEYSRNFDVEVDLEIYNGVSANQDGANDFFLVDCIEFFADNLVEIFSRSGTLVYSQKGYDNREFRFEGEGNKGSSAKTLPVGTYFYTISLDDGIQTFQGFLELLR